ncbi:hypothetical protein R5R35_009813 [Gryllus longicercus]|uniref:BZIP domain-containing protein n=1 Tax=Gryllus longicercus TaxID=2509291 RepID=A0AAN9Z867_9ORTH
MLETQREKAPLAAAVDGGKKAAAARSDLRIRQEDMDLIEVLWKQDVDLGVSLDLFSDSKAGAGDGSKGSRLADDDDEDDAIERLKQQTLLSASYKNNDEDDDDDGSVRDEPLDPWAGLAYTVDVETGEYVLKDPLADDLNSSTTGLPDESPSAALIDLPEFSLEEALQLVGLDEDPSDITSDEPSPRKEEKQEEEKNPDSEESASGEAAAVAASPEPEEKSGTESEPSSTVPESTDEDLGSFGEMIQTAQFHHPAPRPFQGRMPLVRAMSMEQRWQDLASLLSLPGPPADTASSMAHPFAHHHHHHHHHHNYGAAAGSPYPPPPDNSRSVLLHNATLAPPMGDLNASSPYSNVTMSGASNLGSAVATSMNLTNSSEPMGESAPGGSYKMENPHDMMYYQNSTAEMNQTTEGFLSSFLNDEDLQLMDMAMNDGGIPAQTNAKEWQTCEKGMYSMRMLENNSSNNGSSVGMPPASEERMDASSDSAVSSMGSERVPSLSDGEWMETGSDSGHTTAGEHYSMDYHGSKYRPYDYSFSGRQHSGGAVGTADSHRMPPMAQKKHQMFGKRYFQEQGAASSLGNHGPAASLPPSVPIKYEYGEAGTAAIAPGNAFSGPVEGAVGAKPPEMKYSCSLEFARHHADARPNLEHVQHNHSYHLPPESSGNMQRPVARDKQKGRKDSAGEHLNRDEKRARAMNIPIPVNDIINLPMDEFNERLSKYDLSEAQLSLIRDIRRRGKNKVAAQNCRKRKLDQILSLADEVKEMRDRKNRLMMEREYMLAERQRVKEKFSQLYHHVFQSLRDPDGNQYSPYEYSLQQSADGSVHLVPRTNSSTVLEPSEAARRKQQKEHDHQHKE